MTLPILPGTDGERKMSKSYGNYVGVAEPPEEIFGKLMRVPDAAMPVYYELLMDEPFDPERPAVESKRHLARSLAARYHGDEAGEAAEAHFDRLHVQRDVPDEIDEAPLPDDDPVHLPALLAGAFGISRSEARRLVGSGGVRIDGEPVQELDVPADRLDGAVVQLGKRRFKRFRRSAENG
jgi:tyrosyl-tRNA synthetase